MATDRVSRTTRRRRPARTRRSRLCPAMYLANFAATPTRPRCLNSAIPRPAWDGVSSCVVGRRSCATQKVNSVSSVPPAVIAVMAGDFSAAVTTAPSGSSRTSVRQRTTAIRVWRSCLACLNGQDFMIKRSYFSCNQSQDSFEVEACPSADLCNVASMSCRACFPGEYQCSEQIFDAPRRRADMASG